MSENTHPQANSPNVPPNKIPFLLSIILYSIAIVCIFNILVLTLFITSHLTQFKALSSFFQSHVFTSKTDWYLYIPLVFSALSLFSVVQMIRQQKHGFILFIALGISLITFILFQSPIDKSNLTLASIIILTVILHGKWFFKKPTTKQPTKAEEKS